MFTRLQVNFAIKKKKKKKKQLKKSTNTTEMLIKKNRNTEINFKRSLIKTQLIVHTK